ncbi:DUF3168 domain-containing protein [Aurantiacibacter poecillastricola]|uniref:DUF3168 domain-containing protein n=1 Tax=Aurantiacibacter poecillastricola TaxID=3064385 RepID=UPI00273F015E|nr:DUF3168 domain-containing protein [Aurantiacibacter sp. 219JJ12-13]MDP5260311.1 DUF3168 domain-containing protein [Aurantiacibacter sp. 219JJ12-13]
MESLLRTALVDWLASDPVLLTRLNAVTEETPARASLPWLGIATSASTDWSTKTARGREVRVALELQTRGDDPAETSVLTALIERRIESLPRKQTGFALASVTFLRSRAEQRERNTRAALVEYRFRILEA